MTHDERIDAYVTQVSRLLAGTATERAMTCAEVEEHLREAAEDGELDGALERLGTPREAAVTFSAARRSPPDLRERFAAAALDNLPLLIVTAALIVHSILELIDDGEGSVALLFPPFVTIETANACVAPLPFACDLNPATAAGTIQAGALLLALAWSIIGLAVLESRSGMTPGKRRRGLRVVSKDGLRVDFSAAIGRRLVFLLGPIAWIDWLPAIWGEHRRITEILSGTQVLYTRWEDLDPRPDVPVESF